MTEIKYIDHKVIDQAMRNAHQARSEEFYRVISSMWKGLMAFFSAAGEGVQAGRKANDIL